MPTYDSNICEAWALFPTKVGEKFKHFRVPKALKFVEMRWVHVLLNGFRSSSAILKRVLLKRP
jgi:hypothetical protein